MSGRSIWERPEMRVESYRLVAQSGRPVRTATRVVFEDGSRISFLDRVPKRQALMQAWEMWLRGDVDEE